MSNKLTIYIFGAIDQLDQLVNFLEELGHQVLKKRELTSENMEQADIILFALGEGEIDSALKGEKIVAYETVPHEPRQKIVVLYPRYLAKEISALLVRNVLRGWSGFNNCVQVPGSKAESSEMIIDALSIL